MGASPPHAAGLLELHVRRGHEATVEGYGGEPWLRVLRDGTVEENTRSPATYLDANRYARDITVPPDADTKAPPQWKTVGHDGHWVWHDHRIHWMSKEATPPQVTDEDRRTKVFDWRVPIEVGARPAAILALAFLVLATAALFVATRRVRERQARR